MVARQHLPDQPEREELNAADDQQDAEHREGPRTDRRAAQLEDRQVEQDRRAGAPEQHPDAAEEMERALAVAAKVGNGQEIEETAGIPLDAVARPSVEARPVVHGNLGGSKAEVMREHG